MGEIIRGKRRQCVYEKADEEVFIKRQRLNSEGDSNDSLDNDTRFTYTAVQTQQSQQTVKDAATAKTSEVSFKYDSFKASQAPSEVAKEQSPPVKAKTSPRLRLKKVEPCAESAAGTDSREVAIRDVEADRQDTEDNREVNRRSPNGFLLPDPLPKGELLRDTLGQVRLCGRNTIGPLFQRQFLLVRGFDWYLHCVVCTICRGFSLPDAHFFVLSPLQSRSKTCLYYNSYGILCHSLLSSWIYALFRRGCWGLLSVWVVSESCIWRPGNSRMDPARHSTLS